MMKYNPMKAIVLKLNYIILPEEYDNFVTRISQKLLLKI